MLSGARVAEVAGRLRHAQRPRGLLHLGAPTARAAVASPATYGFTSQYSNQDARLAVRVRLRIVTSCSSSGSSPNGA